MTPERLPLIKLKQTTLPFIWKGLTIGTLALSLLSLAVWVREKNTANSIISMNYRISDLEDNTNKSFAWECYEANLLRQGLRPHEQGRKEMGLKECLTFRNSIYEHMRQATPISTPTPQPTPRPGTRFSGFERNP